MATTNSEPVMDAARETALDAIRAKGPLGLEAAEAEAAVQGVSLMEHPALALDLIKAFRLARKLEDARILILALADGHSADMRLQIECVNLLHRTQSWQDSLTLLAVGRQNRVLRNTPSLRVVEADCHCNLGAFRKARAAVQGLTPDQLTGVRRAILFNVQSKLELVEQVPEIEAIEDELIAGNALKAGVMFRSLLHTCRTQVAVTTHRTLQDEESRAFAERFPSFDTLNPTRSVVMVTDSIALPRSAIGVEFEDTYPQKVQEIISAASQGFLSVAPFCRRGRTIDEVADVVAGLPKGLAAILIQDGIVDCAPRVFSKVDINAVRKTKGEFAANALIALSRDYRRQLQGSRHTSPYVPVGPFGVALARTLRVARAKAGVVGVLTIVTPSRNGQKMVDTPLSMNIAEYNAVIRKVAKEEGAQVIDVDEYVWLQAHAAECFTNDNYHFNASGHAICAEIIDRFLIDRLNIRERNISTQSGKR